MKFFESVYTDKKVALDSLDKKILIELSKNARLSHSAIAKKIGANRDTVNYRITLLKKSGVVQAYRTIVDITKFDYINFHVFLQLKNPVKSVLTELISKLKKYTFLRTIIQFNGKYDFEIALVAKNIYECDEILSNVLNDCSDYLQNYAVLFLTKTLVANTFPKRFFEKSNIPEKKKRGIAIKIDQTDIAILEILSEHADMPIFKIAEEIKMSADTVTYRVKRLQESDFILGYVPAINYTLINQSVHAILLSIPNMTEKDVSTMQEFLRTNKDILWAVKTIGRYNLIIYVCTESMEDFIKTTEQLRTYLPNKIKNYEILLNVEEYKYTYLPKGLIHLSDKEK